MITQPEALRLADELDYGVYDAKMALIMDKAAIKLRRLHFKCDALMAALKSIECCTNDPVIAAMVRVAISKAEAV